MLSHVAHLYSPFSARVTPSPRSSLGFSNFSGGEPLYSFSHLLQKYFENLSSGSLPTPAKNSSGPPRLPLFVPHLLPLPEHTLQSHGVSFPVG